MKLIVGLGNPGKEYEKTRHNVGFNLINYIADSKGIIFSGKKYDADYAETKIKEEKVILIKPLKYMNLSGEVVKKYMDYYNIEPENILVIQDDMTMSLGKIRIGFDSTSGGHNGIKNIEENIKTKKYVRLKIGISRNQDMEKVDFVLGKFNEEELKVLEKTYEKVINIIEDFIEMPIYLLKKVYNEKNDIEEK